VPPVRAVTLPACTCGGTLRPPLRLHTTQKGALCAVPDVTEEEEATANAHADAAILRCDRCWATVVLTAERPARYRTRRTPDQSVFDVTPQKEPSK
jgi:hypothetical protein